MSVDLICEMTSAEAGFLYAANRCNDGIDGDWGVDEVTAPPLQEFVTPGAGKSVELDEEALEMLEGARFGSWWRGHRDEAEPKRRRVIDHFFAGPSDDESRPSLESFWGRAMIAEQGRDSGGDISIRGDRYCDLRSFIDGHDAPSLASRLVVAGAVLVSSLDRGSLRRRLAANLRRLPPPVVAEIRARVELEYEFDASLQRRIFEIYRRVAADSGSADEEFALVGLCFLVSACVFRQSGGLYLMHRRLPDSLSRWIDQFAGACMRSGKPELMPLMANALAEVLAVGVADEEEDKDE